MTYHIFCILIGVEGEVLWFYLYSYKINCSVWQILYYYFIFNWGQHNSLISAFKQFTIITCGGYFPSKRLRIIVFHIVLEILLLVRFQLWINLCFAENNGFGGSIKLLTEEMRPLQGFFYNWQAVTAKGSKKWDLRVLVEEVTRTQ